MTRAKDTRNKFNVGVVTYLLDLQKYQFDELIKQVEKIRNKERIEYSLAIRRILK